MNCSRAASMVVPLSRSFLLLGLLACALPGCGGGNSGPREVLGTEVPPPPPPPPPPPTGGRSNVGYPLAVNLEGLSDWCRAIVYTDVFKLSREWIPQLVSGGPWDTGAAINMDADGWVISLDAGNAVATVLLTEQGGNYPTGRYVCLYDGDGGTNSDAFTVFGDGQFVQESGAPGRFEVDITPSISGLTGIKIIKSNPANYVRNIRLILPGFEGTYATTDVYHPSFLKSLEDFRTLRFVNWGRTNFANVATWADRTPGSYCRHASDKGAPIEAMVALCNQTQSDMWFCIPHQADDNYVLQAVTLIRDTLAPNLRLFLENSNEVWNWGFSAAGWAHDRGLQLWPGDSAAWLHYYGLRTAQMMDVATVVFAGQESRLVRILSAQAAWPGAGVESLDQEVTGPNDLAHEHVDAFAIAPYFGGTRIGGPDSEASTEAMTVEQVLDECEADSLATNGPGGSTETNFNNATARGLILIAYEGGQGLVGWEGVENNTTITNLFVAANRHPRMRQLYIDYMSRWTARGGGMFAQFCHTGRYDKWGSWGLLESQFQDPATAYKWLGIKDWLATFPP